MHPRFRAGAARRSATVGRGLAAGLLPCRQMRAFLARTACGARGLVRPTFAAAQRARRQEKKHKPKMRRWIPDSLDDDG